MTVTPERPPFGLLLDVDGPISNPDAKRIVEPTIISSLVTLLDQGIPVVFNTGRADSFIRERVLTPLLSAGPNRVDRLHAVCEKGAVWLSVAADRSVTEELDRQIAVPATMWSAIETLVNERFLATMFFDADERTMVSVERNLATSHNDYKEAQAKFVDAAFELLVEMGFGVALHERSRADADGNVAYRIDPTIIACDIESVTVGKDLGAARAYELLERDDALPKQWRTMGDSDTDYAMARWLHDKGETVKHLDVRDSARAYGAGTFEVLRPPSSDCLFDAAGAAYLRGLVAHLAGEQGIDG